jgi:hypothetical protein
VKGVDDGVYGLRVGHGGYDPPSICFVF